ncbi:MAG: hypothetical protein VB118_06760 [Oscillospiraceae bacterium]|nr:hypothetical protein [Oscillospiraceae bacterium]
MRIVGFELKKLFREKMAVCLFIGCLILNFILCLLVTPKLDNNIGINEYAANYNKDINAVISNAEKHLLSLSDTGSNNYLIEYQKQIIKKYNETKSLDIKAAVDTADTADSADTVGVTELLLYNWQAIFICVICLFSAVRLSLTEHESNMISLLNCAKRGKTVIISTKLVTLLIISVSAVAAMTVSSAAGFLIKYGLHSLMLPIQTSPAFEYCPYMFSFLSATAAKMLMNMASFYMFALSIYLIAMITRKLIPAILVSFLYAAGHYLFSGIGGNNSFLPLCNLYTLSAKSELLLRYHGINIFGLSVSYPVCIISVTAIAVLLLVLFCRILYLCNRRKSPRIVKERTSLQRHKVVMSQHNLLIWELKKQLIKNKAVYIFLLFLSLKIIIFAFSTDYSKTLDDKTYKDYMSVLQGELTDEKESFIPKELWNMKCIMDMKDQMRSDLNKGVISSTEFNKYIDSCYVAEYKSSVLEAKVQTKYVYIKEMEARGIDVCFLYDTGWLSLFLNGFDILLFMMMVFCFARVFSAERESGFETILTSAKNGRGCIYSTKIKATIILSTAFSLIFIFFTIFLNAIRYDFPGGGFPMASLQLPYLPYMDISIIQCAMLVFAAVYIISVLYAIVVCLISRLTKSTILTVFISALPPVLLYINFIMNAGIK